MQELLLTTETSSSKIHIGKGQLQYLRTYIDPSQYDSVFCVVDSTVYNLYGKVIDEGLASPSNAYDLTIAEIESKESNKTLATLEALLDKVSESSCGKSTLFVAIGGGIVCDITGLLAGLWYRGCDVMYVPTTLLAMVDASVGGKCGVDFKGHKNQIGLIIQPKHVVIDPIVLGSLPQEIFRDGCAEIIKHACLADEKLFEQLKKKPLTTSEEDVAYETYHLANEDAYVAVHEFSYTYDELEDLIAQNIEIKASFVQPDEFDHGVRAALNYGHTVGHAFEAATDMQVSHGEAVAQGIVFANIFGQKRMITDPDFAEEARKLLIEHGLLVNETKFNVYRSRHRILNTSLVEDVISHLSHDKKASGDQISFVFVKEPGKYYIEEVELEKLKKTVKYRF